MSTVPMREPVSQAQVNGLVEDMLPQGCWSDDDYLRLTDRTRRLVELTDGCLEIPPAPSRGHQRILAFLYSAFHAFLRPLGGEALFAPLRLRIRPGKFREPDLLLVRDARDARSGDRLWTGADVVVEVVSPDRPERDLVHKRDDYAEAGIPLNQAMDSRFRGNDVISARHVTFRLAVIPAKLVPAKAGIHFGQRIPKLELQVS